MKTLIKEMGGYTHTNVAKVINNIIDGYSLTDIWRDMHPDINTKLKARRLSTFVSGASYFDNLYVL